MNLLYLTDRAFILLISSHNVNLSEEAGASCHKGRNEWKNSQNYYSDFIRTIFYMLE